MLLDYNGEYVERKSDWRTEQHCGMIIIKKYHNNHKQETISADVRKQPSVTVCEMDDKLPDLKRIVYQFFILHENRTLSPAPVLRVIQRVRFKFILKYMIEYMIKYVHIKNVTKHNPRYDVIKFPLW